MSHLTVIISLERFSFHVEIFVLDEKLAKRKVIKAQYYTLTLIYTASLNVFKSLIDKLRPSKINKAKRL